MCCPLFTCFRSLPPTVTICKDSHHANLYCTPAALAAKVYCHVARCNLGTPLSLSTAIYRVMAITGRDKNVFFATGDVAEYFGCHFIRHAINAGLNLAGKRTHFMLELGSSFGILWEKARGRTMCWSDLCLWSPRASLSSCVICRCSDLL